MASITPILPTSSPNKESSKPQDDYSRIADTAHDRIAAILEGSDEDDIEGSWKPAIVSSPSSQLLEQGKGASREDFDLDLDDEDDAATLAVDKIVDNDDDGAAAYARLMKSLYSKPVKSPSPVQDKPPELAPRDFAPEHSGDSDDDMPVKKTKATVKAKARSSPLHSSSPQLPRLSRSPSPNLFVSPDPARRVSQATSPRSNDGSESDEMPSTIANSRLKALVAKKRAEREAKEEAQRRKAQVARKEDAQKQQRLAKQFKEIYSSEMDDGMTEEAQKALTENSRPTQRRAGKKALEEMNRETQRMARNQQLAHQARVKRKFTTLDFVKSFGLAVDATPGSDDQPRNRGALESSDNEGKIAEGTPPSSPPSLGNGHEKAEPGNMAAANEDEYIIRTGTDAVNEDEELPDLNHLLSDPIRRADKGKSKVTMSSSPKRLVPTERPEKATTKRIRVVPSTRTEDSDDELEIVSSKKPSRFAVFDLLPDRKAHEPASLLNLRALAHMSPPTKKHRNGRHHSMTQAELQMRLAQEMHKQTVAEKQERIEALRARGVVFKTEEEIEEDQLFIENALEKARKEAMELGRKENEAAKKNGEDIDENYALPSDDESEEGDFGEEEEDDDADVEVSGSEDEEGGEVDPAAAGASLFDDAAEEAGEDEDEDEDADTESNDGIMDDAQPDIDEDMASPVLTKSRSKARNRHVILDDDDDHDANSAKPSTPTAIAPTQSQTSPINAFGFAAPNASMGLTQIFQGTMADLATQEENTQATPSGRSLEFLRDVPVATLLPVSPAIPSADLLVESSQSHLVTPAKQPQSTSATPHFTPQFLTPGAVGSQMSPTKLFEIPEPTQDAGFDNFRAAALDMPFSTVETVMMPVSEPAVAPKKGKLHRRAQRIAQFSDDEGAKSDDDSNGKEGEFELTTNAFDALFKASKKPTVVDAFDKKRSEAKNVVEDQAEESEDEYAGLGGASDDDSDNEVDEEVQKMIDEGPVDVKEGELAKFFADKDRADDEKRVDKLYRDITTGALRRKRGAGIDELSDDSDDEAAERRRQKQREFAKMRKALLEDENVGKIAENPKKLAFLRAIEDRDEEDGIDYLGEMEEYQGIPGSQEEALQEAQQALPAPENELPNLTANIGTKRKLPADFEVSAPGKENVAPSMSHRRRPGLDGGTITKRATTIADIRESLSFLIDEPLVPNSQVSDNSDDEAEEDEDSDGPSRRVRQKRNDGNGSSVLTTVRASVVNRLTLSRNNSMGMDEDSQASGPVAFHTSNSISSGGFKIPSLLRRATTNLSSTSSNSSGATTPVTNENAVRMGGSKRSNIHFQAREAERMKKVQDADRRRTEGIRKSVVGKGRTSVLGNSLGSRNSGFE